MTPEEHKERLALDLAAAVLEAGLSSRDNIFRTVSVLASAAMPTYVAALVYLGEKMATVSLAIKFTPIVLWVGSLCVCVILLFPREQLYDLKNLESILSVHSQSLNRARFWGGLSLALLLLGIAVAAFVLLTGQVRVPDMPPVTITC